MSNRPVCLAACLSRSWRPLNKSQLVRSRPPTPTRTPRSAGSLRAVASNLLDETLRVLAPDERLDSVAERVGRARAEIDDCKYEHHHTSAGKQLLKDLLVAVLKLEMAGVCPYPEINAIHSLQ